MYLMPENGVFGRSADDKHDDKVASANGYFPEQSV